MQKRKPRLTEVGGMFMWEWTTIAFLGGVLVGRSWAFWMIEKVEASIRRDLVAHADRVHQLEWAVKNNTRKIEEIKGGKGGS